MDAMERREIPHVLKIDDEVQNIAERRVRSLEVLANQIIGKPGLRGDRTVTCIFVTAAARKEAPFLRNVIVISYERRTALRRVDGYLARKKQEWPGPYHMREGCSRSMCGRAAADFAWPQGSFSRRPQCNRIDA